MSYSLLQIQASDETEEDSPLPEVCPAEAQTNRRKCVIAAVLAGAIVLVIVVVVVVFLHNEEKDMINKLALASDHPLCTDIGRDILLKNGSAVDATIAVLLCLGAVQPQSNGIGGGGFMLVHTKDEDKVINFRERAPAAAKRDMFVETDDGIKKGEWAKYGGLASGVPGEIRGYWTAHQKYGKLPWKDLFSPSIDLLNNGIEVTAHMEKALRYKKDKLLKCKNFRRIFFNDENDVESYKKVGESFTNPMLAATYQRIANEGPDAFYTGTIAENMVLATKNSELSTGILTEADLDSYEVTIDEPFKFTYRGKQVISVPPPASGHVIALALQILDNFDIPTFSHIKAWNYILEAMRFGYAMRSKTGDPLFSTVTADVVDQVRSKSYEKKLVTEHFTKSDLLKPYWNIYDYSDKIYYNYDGTHTTHVSVLGPDGEAVACTSTVNLYFGSCVMTDDGIVMNNEMDDFSTPGLKNAFGYPPSPENYIIAGKRPMSSSSPTIVFDDQGMASFVTGAAGGSRIISATLLSLINALDWKMSLVDNLKSGRMHDQLDEKTYYEDLSYITDFPVGLISDLGDMGYNMTVKEGVVTSVVTSVSKLRNLVEAAGDPRKNGTGIVIDLGDS